ncbi:type I-G CRISPR-associated protein Csb2 [Mobilicoccus caccae]|uniref:CRISPR-associated protein Csb2 n=1 Tax=Mobilicoccus caccae TaxID=1859295 RepID=A0ABQ6IVQ6_9MICO|nr:type I-U CRISPR-associated protein Csb2 [Mobilicoccus caccae]GMA41222.1 hypothetical protein GCM10025883_32670 [Mobilicoccus caccae]
MSSFGITARFPLGTYQGHRDGRSEALPDITRLFDALTHAAGTGSLAEERDGDLRPSAASRVALEWLEAHPPSALHLPWTQMSTAPVTAYRAEGVFDGRKGQASDRKTQRAVGASALAGPIGWMWDDDPPPAVKDTLASLIGDVAYLGEAESPVVLEIGTLRSTHRCEPEASPLVPLDGRVVRAPVTGRFAALEVAYEARYPSKRPGVGHDAFSWSQLPTSARVPVERSEELAYARVRMSPPPAPWSEVFLIPVVTRDGESPEFAGRDRVRWSVATHRALVAQPALAYTASPVVTGRYPARVRERHVNRVAIHPLGVEVMRSASPTILEPVSPY